MLRYLLAIVIAATSLSPAAAAPARSKTASPAQAKAEADLGALLSQTMKATEPYQSALLEANALSLEVVTGLETAVKQEPGSKAAKAWAESWSQEIRAKSDRLKAHVDALTPFPPPLYARWRRAGPGTEKLLELLPIAVREVNANTQAFTDQTITLVNSAMTAEDPEAMSRLAQNTIVGMRLLIEGENSLLILQIANTQKDHPQSALNHSILASNQAIVEILKYWESMFDHERLDLVATGHAVSDKAKAAGVAARRIKPLAASARQKLSVLSNDTLLKSKMNAVIANYTEAGEVEIQLADMLETIAQRMIANDQELAAGDFPLSGTEALVDRRMQLQLARQAAMK